MGSNGTVSNAIIIIIIMNIADAKMSDVHEYTKPNWTEAHKPGDTNQSLPIGLVVVPRVVNGWNQNETLHPIYIYIYLVNVRLITRFSVQL